MASDVLKKALMASAAEEYLNINLVSEAEKWEPSAKLEQQMELLLRTAVKPKKRSLRYTLLVAAVIVLISVTAIFSVAQVRERVIQFFREYYYTHFNMEYGRDEAGDIIIGDGINTVYTFSQLPEGYAYKSRTENEHTVITVWEDENENTIILSQGDGMTKRSVDAERLEKTEIISDGTVYEIYSEDGYSLMFWNTDEYTFSVDHFGKLSAQELVKMAENLRGES